MKHTIKYKYIFEWTYTIEAESEDQALEKIKEHCWCTLNSSIHSTLPNKDVDRHFDSHPIYEWAISDLPF
jgi:hypothetical protein